MQFAQVVCPKGSAGQGVYLSCEGPTLSSRTVRVIFPSLYGKRCDCRWVHQRHGKHLPALLFLPGAGLKKQEGEERELRQRFTCLGGEC